MSEWFQIMFISMVVGALYV